MNKVEERLYSNFLEEEIKILKSYNFYREDNFFYTYEGIINFNLIKIKNNSYKVFFFTSKYFESSFNSLEKAINYVIESNTFI